MASIFLSHSSKDHGFVEELATKLKEYKLDVWIDEKEIKVGDNFIEKITESLIKSDFVIIVLSSNSVESAWVKEEATFTINREVTQGKPRLIPLLLEKVELPVFLETRSYADFTDNTRFDEEFEYLLEAFDVNLPKDEKSKPISQEKISEKGMSELTIEYIKAPDDSAQQVEVTLKRGWETKKAKTPFQFEYTEQNRNLIQWYMEDYILYPYDVFVDRANEAERLMQKKGEELFNAVFSDKHTNDLYSEIKDSISQHRIKICAVDPIGRSLPWELLFDPDKGYLAQKAYSFVRSRSNISATPYQTRKDTSINILMVISRPHGGRDVRFQSVARKLLEVFRNHRDRITLDILRPPTYERLVEVLAEKPNYYHIIHFDGHGSLSRTAGTHLYYGSSSLEGVLAFENNDGSDEPTFVSGKKLGELLKAKNIPVVMLNACQSGMADPESMFPSLGDELVGADVQGVVAMAYSVYMVTAVKFMAKVYELLVNGNSLERAVSASREILYTDDLHESPVGEIPLKDWSVPVIFQSGSIRLFDPPKQGFHLSIKINDQQEKAGTEIDFPVSPDYGFIGRDTLMLDMERAFRKDNVILLQGMAGMGKSTSAIGFARWLAETGGINGPIFFFDFQNYLALDNVCEKIGLIFQGSLKQQGIEWHLLNQGQREQMALNILRQVPCLVIWDNFETVVGLPGIPSLWKDEERNQLRDFLPKLRNGNTKVIITSRTEEKWLGTWMERLVVSGLDMLESNELASKIFEKRNIDRKKLNPYTELLKYLQGNPLSIQIIMPELGYVEPDELLRQLQSGEAKLRFDDEIQGRTRSLTVSLNYRLGNLDPSLKKRLSILALFQGVVNTSILQLMCEDEDIPDELRNIDRVAWEKILDSACDMGIVQRLWEGIYKIHPALPWFFSTALDESFPDDRERLERIFARVCGEYSGELHNLFDSDPQTAMAYLQLEEPNFTHALRLARRYGDWDSMANVLYGLDRLMDISGRWTERERIIADVEKEANDRNGDPLARREKLWTFVNDRKAEIAMNHRDFVTATSIYQKMADYCEKQAGSEWKTKNQFTDHERYILSDYAGKLHQMGNIAYYQRQLAEAEVWYKQSLEIEKKIGNEQGLAISLHQLGMIAEGQRQFNEAEAWYKQSLEIYIKIGDERAQAITLHNLGIIAQKQEQFTEAEVWSKQSLEITKRIDDKRTQAMTLHELGMIARKRRQFDKAEAWYKQSLDIEIKIVDEHGQAMTLHQLGLLAEARGNMKEAEQFLMMAEAIFTRINDPYNFKGTQENLKRIRGQK